MEKDKEYYIALLKDVFQRESRLPKKSDFSQEDVNRIKGYFGPWPWALEAAGLKESCYEERRAKNIEKRQRARQKRKEIKRSECDLPKEGNVYEN